MGKKEKKTAKKSSTREKHKDSLKISKSKNLGPTTPKSTGKSTKSLRQSKLNFKVT